MKLYLILTALCFALTACSTEQSPNANHGSHVGNVNSPNANLSAVDHNSMNHAGTAHGPAGHGSMQSSPGAATAPIELQFLDTMIAHHKGAVEMAMLAETRGQHPELKELAANIISEQEREIAKMTEWRNNWYDGKPEAVNMEFPGMMEGMAGMNMDRLASLSGNAFDIELLKQMIPHHEGAVEMSNSLKGKTTRGELHELAEDIVASQEAEIKQMRDWIAAWQTSR